MHMNELILKIAMKLPEEMQNVNCPTRAMFFLVHNRITGVKYELFFKFLNVLRLNYLSYSN